MVITSITHKYTPLSECLGTNVRLMIRLKGPSKRLKRCNTVLCIFYTVFTLGLSRFLGTGTKWNVCPSAPWLRGQLPLLPPSSAALGNQPQWKRKGYTSAQAYKNFVIAEFETGRVMSSSGEDLKYGFQRQKSFFIEDILGRADTVGIQTVIFKLFTYTHRRRINFNPLSSAVFQSGFRRNINKICLKIHVARH